MNRDTKIDQCLKIAKAEKQMRFIVFKNRPQEQYTKCEEMSFIIRTLEELKVEVRPSLFDLPNTDVQ